MVFQGIQRTIGKACNLILSTHETLKKLKEGSSFEIICKKARNFAMDNGIDFESSSMQTSAESTPVVKSKRVREVSKRLKEFVVSSSLGKRLNMNSFDDESSFFDAYKGQVFEPALTKLLQEYERRLVDHCETFSDMNCLDPSSELFLDSEIIGRLAARYPHFFSELEIEVLKSQAQTAKNMVKSDQAEQLGSIHDLIKEIMVLPAAFDQFLHLIRIAITLPVTSASTERFFSALKRVKTYTRGTMGGERLSNLLVICTESECVKKLNFDSLVDKFGRAKPRRYPVLL